MGRLLYRRNNQPRHFGTRTEGEVGELVLTTINREAMPLLRYRTRDLTRILPGECPCGRHHKRLDRMKGRSDDMIILKGVNIFPIQIETIYCNSKNWAVII